MADNRLVLRSKHLGDMLAPGLVLKPVTLPEAQR
jgi:hypothetical protein